MNRTRTYGFGGRYQGNGGGVTFEITGTSTTTTQARGGSTTQTQYRDASGRSAGSATTHVSATGSPGSSRTTYRDASGRVTGSETTQGNRTMTTTRRDASGRVIGSSTGNGSCATGTRVPVPPKTNK